MSEELQAADAELETQEHVEDSEQVEQSPEGASESASDTGKNQEAKIEFDENQQRKVDELIGKQVYQRKELERKAQDLERKLAEVSAKVPVEARPNVPPVPDWSEFDTDSEFHQAVAARDKALREQVAYDQRQQLVAEQQQRQAQEKEQQRLQALAQKAQNFEKNAVASGVKKEDLVASVSYLNNIGMTQELGEYIMSQNDGGLMTTYLAKNPLVAEKLLTANPFQAGEILQEVKAKAAQLKPKTTNAPPPIDTDIGNGVPNPRRGPKGAKYY